MSSSHFATIEWQFDVCEERIQRLGARKLPSGISRLASASTPLIPLLTLDTIRPMFLPAISAS